MRQSSTRGESFGILAGGEAATWGKETMPRMPWIIALLAAAIFLLAPGKAGAQQYSGASTSIRCRSTDGRFRHCPVNGWVRGAQLTRQIGGANCAQGRSWGYDNMGVWVDRGCRADFEIVDRRDREWREWSRDWSDDDRRGWDRDHGRDRGRDRDRDDQPDRYRDDHPPYLN